MKKFLGLFFALAMILGVAFVADSLSVMAQRTGNVTVKKKNRSLASKTWRGGKYVYRKSANGVRYVYRKTSKGTVYVGKQTYKGGKWTFNKSKKAVKKVF
ncbi:MAG TPA: hypothetical protein PKE69_22785 [Pyrinomonadaceae bacterium]|nr:hypothetical protein [Pyrinomonadaceae bacterium]